MTEDQRAEGFWWVRYGTHGEGGYAIVCVGTASVPVWVISGRHMGSRVELEKQIGWHVVEWGPYLGKEPGHMQPALLLQEPKVTITTTGASLDEVQKPDDYH